jgi:hypothetical protein
MLRRIRVAFIILILSTLSGLALTDAFGLGASPRHIRASSSHEMLPINANVLAASSNHLLKRKHRQEPTAVKQPRRTQSFTVPPLSSPTNGASDSPACIPAVMC